MRLRENERSGKDVLMDAKELQQVIDYFEFGNKRWLAISLLGRCGLKTGEALSVNSEQVITDADPKLLRIYAGGQVGRLRPVPIPDDMAAAVKLHTENNKPAVDNGKRTVRKWASNAGEYMADKTGDSGWEELSPKSFRHSWALGLLDDGVPPHLVMRWGGWNNTKNFVQLYMSDYSESDYSVIYESDLFTSKPPSDLE